MQNRSINAFAFDGAGIIGPFAYAAAVLETYKHIDYNDIEHVIGTSSGAMSAIGACMYLPNDIFNHLSTFDTTQLIKPRSLVWTLFNFAYRFGTHDNTGIRASIETIVEFKTGDKDITFGEMKQKFHKDLYIITATVCKVGSTHTIIPFIFSPYNAKDTSVVSVALASTAIAGYFPYVRLKEIKDGCFQEVNQGGNIYLDAVFIPNFHPVNILVEELQKRDTSSSAESLRAGVLGFFVKSGNKNTPIPTCLPSFRPHIMLWAILNRILYDMRHLNDNHENSIYIDPQGISPINFNISAKQKEQLFISGTRAGAHFFKANAEISSEIITPAFHQQKVPVDYANLMVLGITCAALIRGTYQNGVRSGLWSAAKTYIVSDAIKDIATYKR